MKKLSTIVVVCLPLFAMGQIEKGKSFVSGFVGVNTSNPKNPAPNNIEHSFEVNISGTYGLLVADRWAIGISPDYGQQWQRTPSGAKGRNFSFGISPFVRRYFSIGEKLFLHLDGGINFSSSTNYGVSAEGQKGPVTKSSSTSLSIRPGASFFLTNKVALTAGLGNISFGWNRDGNGFSANLGARSLTLGAAVYF